MGELPERVWAPSVDILALEVFASLARKKANSGQAYLRADTAIPKAEADALLAAAFKQAQNVTQVAWSWPESEASSAPVCEAIADLTPAEARAALDAIVREAVEAERERCAKIAENLFRDDSTGEVIAAAIREEPTS